MKKWIFSLALFALLPSLSQAASQPTRLAFLTQPSALAYTNVPFEVQPTVGIVDEEGKVSLQENRCIVTISLVTSWESGSLRGAVAKTFTNGLANFAGNNLRVAEKTEPGTYRLLATANMGAGCETLAPAVSEKFQVE